MTVLDIEVWCGGEPVFGDVEAGRAVPENNQPLRIGVWKRMQQKAVYDAEYRGIRADPDGQREERRNREGGRGDQDARSVTHVFQEGIHTDSNTSGDQCLKRRVSRMTIEMPAGPQSCLMTSSRKGDRDTWKTLSRCIAPVTIPMSRSPSSQLW